eukprot:1479292-Rhodomonas_salina.3
MQPPCAARAQSATLPRSPPLSSPPTSRNLPQCSLMTSGLRMQLEGKRSEVETEGSSSGQSTSSAADRTSLALLCPAFHCTANAEPDLSRSRTPSSAVCISPNSAMCAVSKSSSCSERAAAADRPNASWLPWTASVTAA